jgi:hypothetical protein
VPIEEACRRQMQRRGKARSQGRGQDVRDLETVVGVLRRES